MPLPRRIKRIIVTGDFLRTFADGTFAQWSNIRWLTSFLSPLFGRLTDLPAPEMIEGEKKERGHAQLFYAASALEPSPRSWMQIFRSACNPRQLAMLADWFEDALVIGFELPEVLIDGLRRLGLPYIDFTIHPVRFMTELAWGARSNIRDLQEAFEPYMLKEEDIRHQAGLAIAKYSRFPQLESCMGKENIGLLACQTLLDRVLIQKGRVLTLETFRRQITEASRAHDLLLVKEHPLEKQPPSVIARLRSLPNVAYVKDNFYRLLSQKNLKAVYSISSSCSVEARYFGKSGIHFTEYPLAFSYDAMTDSTFLAITSCLHKGSLWRAVFELLDLPLMTKTFDDPPVDYRSNLSAWWDAKEIYI